MSHAVMLSTELCHLIDMVGDSWSKTRRGCDDSQDSAFIFIQKRFHGIQVRDDLVLFNSRRNHDTFESSRLDRLKTTLLINATPQDHILTILPQSTQDE
jgi:hypothetical protein